jgi:tight adherence protein B
MSAWVAAALACAAVLVLVGPRAPGLRRLAVPDPARGSSGALPVGRLHERVRAAVRRRTEADRERARAVEACAALAAELRAGRPPDAALGAVRSLAVGPTADVLAAAAAAASLGGDVPEVLARGAPSTASPALLRGLAACWSLCASTGAGLAAAVERLEAAERDALDRRREVRTELAGPRATARMLAALPVLGLLLAGGLGASPAWLVSSPLGLACLVLGAGLDALGLLWTRRLVTRAEAVLA